MRLQRINVKELDRSLTCWKAESEIEAKYRTKLVLNLDRLEERMMENPPRERLPWEIMCR